MTKSCRGWYWRFGLASSLAIGGALATSFDCALAQITPDGTLSSTQAQIGPGEFAPLRSAVNSAVRSKKPIPAWFPSGRWMFVDIRELIAPTCSAYLGQKSSQFIISGRGGLPPTPREALRSDAVQVDLGRPIQGGENRSSAAIPIAPTRVSAPNQIVEAQGWVINNKGEVVLTARPSSVTPHSPRFPAANCHMNQTSS